MSAAGRPSLRLVVAAVDLISSVHGSAPRAVVRRGHGTTVVVTGRQGRPGAPVTVGLDHKNEAAATLIPAMEGTAWLGSTLRVVDSSAPSATADG